MIPWQIFSAGLIQFSNERCIPSVDAAFVAKLYQPSRKRSITGLLNIISSQMVRVATREVEHRYKGSVNRQQQQQKSRTRQTVAR